MKIIARSINLCGKRTTMITVIHTDGAKFTYLNIPLTTVIRSREYLRGELFNV